MITELLYGKMALAMGVSRGNGKGIAEIFAQQGAHVILAASSEDVWEVKAHLHRRGWPAMQVVFDGVSTLPETNAMDAPQ